MNNVSLTGRLTREPELRYGGQDNSTAITRFTLAVDDGKDTDFINIKCFGRTAEWAQKWLSKGSRVEVTGKIKTGSYTYTVLVLQTCSSRWLLQQVSLNLLSASCWLLLLMFVLTSLLITRFSKEGRNYDRKQEFWQQSV